VRAGPGFSINIAGVAAHLSRSLGQLAKPCRVQGAHRHEHAGCLEQHTASVHGVDVADLERGDVGTTVVLGGDDALRLQHPHRLAKWRPADAESLGQLDLRDAGAVGDGAIEDQLAQVFVE